MMPNSCACLLRVNEIVFSLISMIYPAVESPKLTLVVECFLPIAGCRVLGREPPAPVGGAPLSYLKLSLYFTDKKIESVQDKL